MLTEEDVRRLLSQQTETKNLDYKEACNWSTTDSDNKCQLVKDILAMANTQDGGQLVFGVKDRSFEFVGMETVAYESFDPTRLNDYVRRYTDPPFACTVYKFMIDGRRTVVIEVPEFSEVPIVCKLDANSTNPPRNTILKKGGLYVRTDKPSSELVSSAEEMRDIVARASRKKREELLRTIRDLLEGHAAAPDLPAQEGYAAELEDAGAFFASSLPAEFDAQGHWRVVAHPRNYLEERLTEHQKLTELIRNSTVALRGWDFPHTDRETAANFARGAQSQTAFMHHVEAYRVYLSGLFCWKSAFWENEVFRDQNVLSFIGIIFEFTEILQFLKRFYSGLPHVDNVKGSISMVNVRGLTLASMRPDVDLFSTYACREQSIELPLNVTMAELQADADSIARRLAKRAFAVFNWNDIKDEQISFWQQKFLSRTY